MKFYFSTFLQVPQLYINVFCLRHQVDQAYDNTANKSIYDKHEDESTHEYIGVGRLRDYGSPYW